jgi:hypothetical protein
MQQRDEASPKPATSISDAAHSDIPLIHQEKSQHQERTIFKISRLFNNDTP